MFAKKIACVVLAVLISLSFSFVSLAADTTQPTLTLTVERSSLDVYPPMMIYTAQLNNAPSGINTDIKVDFYNLRSSVFLFKVEYLGSAPIDSATGKAVLERQVKPDVYFALAKVTINGVEIKSNTVTYQLK